MAGREGSVARLVLQGLWAAAVKELDAQANGGKRGAKVILDLERPSVVIGLCCIAEHGYWNMLSC